MTSKNTKKNKSRTRTQTRTQTRKQRESRRIRKGGKVIGSGGYGCVFRPALKCKGSRRRVSGTISKLMSKRHTINEYTEIVKFLPILKKIPNYKEYFIIEGASICQPARLSSSDLEMFDSKCKALKSEEITKDNINQSLDKLDSLNLPDGGINVGEYVDSGLSNIQLKSLNESLIKLLEHGIVPMNKYNIYHADVKESNMLIDPQTHNVRLIDWGLSTKYDDGKIPYIMYKKPFQYNLPFSSILMNDTFPKMYKEFLKLHTTSENDAIVVFLRKYIEEWDKKRGSGHRRLIISLWKIISGKENILDAVIIPYLARILVKYTKNGDFQMMKYFKEVYLKNIDIWGFVMAYSSILEYRHERRLPIKALSSIYMKHLYETATEPISVEKLVHSLRYNLL